MVMDVFMRWDIYEVGFATPDNGIILMFGLQLNTFQNHGEFWYSSHLQKFTFIRGERKGKSNVETGQC
jgi:hypothetical protein